MLDEICTGILYRDPVPFNTSYRNIVRVEDVDHEFLLRASLIHFKRKRKSRDCWNRRKIATQAAGVDLESWTRAEVSKVARRDLARSDSRIHELGWTR